MIIPRTKMSQAEFRALPESNQPLERIHGELVVSPTPIHAHQRTGFQLAKLIEKLTPGGEVVLSPMGVYLGDEDNVQPDVFWVRGADSLCKLGSDGYWYGAPDLVVEVLSPSTEFKDRHDKYACMNNMGCANIGWSMLSLPSSKSIF